MNLDINIYLVLISIHTHVAVTFLRTYPVAQGEQSYHHHQSFTII